MESHSEVAVEGMNFPKGTVLVTGAEGFTGRYVAAALARRGFQCAGLTAADGGAINLADVAGVQEALRRIQPTHVIHLAAVAFVAHENASDFYTTNLLGTRNLLMALAEENVAARAVILASSANVYGNSREVCLSEDSPVAPANDYAVSKLAMEHMAWTWADRLPITVVRPFNYTGVGQSELFLVPKLVSHFVRREPRILLGNLDVARDFSDVRVVADTYARLLDADSAGKTLNICSGRAVTLQALIKRLEALAGYRIRVEISKTLVRENEVKALQGVSDRLMGVLPDYSPIPIEETLRWMVEFPGSAGDAAAI